MTLRTRLGLPTPPPARTERAPEPVVAPKPPEWVQRMQDERERNLRETGIDRVATKELGR